MLSKLHNQVVKIFDTNGQILAHGLLLKSGKEYEVSGLVIYRKGVVRVEDNNIFYDADLVYGPLPTE